MSPLKIIYFIFDFILIKIIFVLKAYHNKDDSTGDKPCPQSVYSVLGAFFIYTLRRLIELFEVFPSNHPPS
jgi:hypothetical protein